MTTQCRFLVTESTGATELTHIGWQAPVAGTATAALAIRVYNASATVNCTDVLLFVVRGDIREDDPAGEDAESTAAMGRELIAETWLEAKIGAGAWTPLEHGGGSGFSLGAINAAQYVAVSLRLNIAATAASVGEISFGLRIAATN
jgi:hypothetical protein